MKESLIELPRRLMPAEVRSQSFDEKANTIEVIWTTGATVRRCTWMDGAYDEELVVGSNNVRLERLNSGAPFLNSHDAWDLSGVLGSVVPGSARIASGQGVATVQLSRREDLAGIVQDIRDGVIRNVSCGYRYHKIEKTETDDGTVPVWRIVDWEPLELSAVSIPADPGAQIRAEGDRAPAQFPCIVTRAHIACELPLHVANSRLRMQLSARAMRASE